MSEMDVRGDDLPVGEEELSIEAEEADTADQRLRLREEETQHGEYPVDANPADAVEQDRVVGLDDDDDYR